MKKNIKIHDKKSIQLVINYFGGVPKTAKALGITRAAIHMWQYVPILRAYQIESLTHGKIKAVDLIGSEH